MNATEHALQYNREALEIFARIGRWGTCVDCPESGGKFFPEFCKNTHRYDHKLRLEDICEQYNNRLKSFIRKQNEN